MGGKDILGRVRRAVHLADSLQKGDTALAQRLLLAAEHCKEANREFLDALESLRPTSPAGQKARAELLQQLSDNDCGDKLLNCMLETGVLGQSEIHTRTPPDQLQ